MAIYHCATKPLARSSGRSAVAAAYRAGACLCDERQGIQHDYSRRSGVLHAEIVLPEGAGSWSRADLWNAAEKAEKCKDGRTAREWEVALPTELPAPARRELAVRFADSLAARYGCAVDVALHAPDRQGDHRNWHAHLLATTRQVTAQGLGEKCAIELSDAKRLSLGLAPARMEVETVRQMWGEEVNRQLEAAKSPERVDHRSLATQREEALQKGDAQKAAELDRAPQVKLGWKVVQMERRGDFSDRANQLRAVKAENVQRQAVVLDIGQLRAQLVRRQTEQAFRGKSRQGQEATLNHWRYLANQKIPDVENARAHWELDKRDPDANAWRETRDTVAWQTKQVAQSAQAITDWQVAHPVQSLILRTGLRKPSAALQRLEQRYSQVIRFLAGSQKRLQGLEQVWERKAPIYQQQLEQEGGEIREARRNLQVVEQNSEHFQQVWEREDRIAREAQQQREQYRSRDHDRGR